MASNHSKSKKRSEPSSQSKLPNDLVFFLDRSLGKKQIAEALRIAGVTVLIHDDHFPPDEPDINWLKVAGDNNWIVLTKDSRIRYRALEKMTLLKAGVAAFILTSADLKGKERKWQKFSSMLFQPSQKRLKNIKNRLSLKSPETGRLQLWITSDVPVLNYKSLKIKSLS